MSLPTRSFRACHRLKGLDGSCVHVCDSADVCAIVDVLHPGQRLALSEVPGNWYLRLW